MKAGVIVAGVLVAGVVVSGGLYLSQSSKTGELLPVEPAVEQVLTVEPVAPTLKPNNDEVIESETNESNDVGTDTSDSVSDDSGTIA